MYINNQLSGVSIGDNLKAESIGMAVRAMTGEFPPIERTDDYVQINFTENQANELTNLLSKWSSSEPGTLRVNTGQVLIPYLVKKYIPYALIGSAVIFLIGKLSKRKK